MGHVSPYISTKLKLKFFKRKERLKMSSALDRQVGGNYYKQYAIQPYEFFLKNHIPHHKAAIIRRILRYDQSGGKGKEDLDKITHEVELIIEIEGWKSTPSPTNSSQATLSPPRTQ